MKLPGVSVLALLCDVCLWCSSHCEEVLVTVMSEWAIQLCPEDHVMSFGMPWYETTECRSQTDCAIECLSYEWCLAFSLAQLSTPESQCSLYNHTLPMCQSGLTENAYLDGTLDDCPPGFEQKSSLGSCYYVIITRIKPQPEAYALCQQYGSRVHLVAIETAQEQAFLESFLAEHYTACGSRFWTGGESNNTDTSIKSSWNWNLTDTSTALTYTNWAGGEPNNFKGNEKYLFLHESSWYDVQDWVGCPVCEYNPLH